MHRHGFDGRPHVVAPPCLASVATPSTGGGSRNPSMDMRHNPIRPSAPVHVWPRCDQLWPHDPSAERCAVSATCSDLGVCWWAMGDLNPRPLPCEGSAHRIPANPWLYLTSARFASLQAKPALMPVMTQIPTGHESEPHADSHADSTRTQRRKLRAAAGGCALH